MSPPNPIADDFCLLAHDEYTGKPLLHGTALGLGLAAGLLTELCLHGCMSVYNGQLLPDLRLMPAEPVAHQVLELVCSERHDLATWLQFLARDARERVGQRLTDKGAVYREQRRWSRQTRFVPVNPDKAAWPAIRLRRALLENQLTYADRILAALVVVTELSGRVLLWDGNVSRAALPPLVNALPPPLREVARCTEQVVGQVVLAH